MWRVFLSELDEGGHPDRSQRFIDGSFSSVKKQVSASAQLPEERSGCWWSTARAFR
jgi:hypothetical protein